MRFPVTLVNEITPKVIKCRLMQIPKIVRRAVLLVVQVEKGKKFVAEVLVGRTENADS